MNISKQGYIRIGQKLEHRIIFEKFINRPLKSYEIIHHINGNKMDNRIENLEMLTRSEHAKKHCNNEKIQQFNSIRHLGVEKQTKFHGPPPKPIKIGQRWTKRSKTKNGKFIYNSIVTVECQNCKKLRWIAKQYEKSTKKCINCFSPLSERCRASRHYK